MQGSLGSVMKKVSDISGCCLRFTGTSMCLTKASCGLTVCWPGARYRGSSREQEWTPVAQWRPHSRGGC